MPATPITGPEAPSSAPAAQSAGSAAPADTVVHAENVELVVTAGEIDPAEAVRRTADEGLGLHRRYLKDIEAAARVLTTCRASPAERAEAETALVWFTTEYLLFSEQTQDNDLALDQLIERFEKPVRARFDRRFLERMERFPFWPAIIAELVSGRWRHADVQRSVAYVRVALLRVAFRYYAEAVQELRSRDHKEVPGDSLVWEALAADDVEPEPLPRTGDHTGQASTRSTDPIDKPWVPMEIQTVVVRVDMEHVLEEAGVPEVIATFVRHSGINGATGVEIAEEVGWSANRLEAVQTSWRDTWRPRMQEAFATGGYTPTPAETAWKKFSKMRATASAKARATRPV